MIKFRLALHKASRQGFCMGNCIAKCTGHAIPGWIAFPFLEESKLIVSPFWLSYFLNLFVFLFLSAGVPASGQKLFEA